MTHAMSAKTRHEALALNNAHAIELSWQDEASFARLIDAAFFARWTDEREAFLIAFAQDAAYAGTHFRWFQARLQSFIYVDRVVVAPQHRGKGLAKQLYTALFEAARNAGHDTIVCEINVDPPNPASDAFHAALGFVEMGRAKVDGTEKSVRYWICKLT